MKYVMSFIMILLISFPAMTGLLLLIDPETKEITERITHTVSADEIRNIIKTKLN